MAYTMPQLLSMSGKDLDDLFSSSPSGNIPNGEAQGTAIIAPGTTYSSEIASLINIFGWQGKNFDAAHGTLRNRILAFGLNAIVAEVYKSASIFAMRSARSGPGCTWVSCTGTRRRRFISRCSFLSHEHAQTVFKRSP